jgi:WD40 repeat protein
MMTLGTALLLAAKMLGADLDANGTLLPPGARVRLGAWDFRIPPGLYYADLSSDGRTIGHIDTGGHLNLTEVQTGAATKGPRLLVMPQARLTFAANGKRFATTDQNDVAVWDVDTGKRLAAIQVRGMPRPQMWAPVTFSADGKRLAVAWGRRESESVYVVWDVDRNALVTEVVSPAMDRDFVALSADGKRLVTWGYREAKVAQSDAASPLGATITVWDTESAKPVHRMAINGAGSRRLSFGPDGKTLAIVGREIELWDTARWEARVRVQGRTGWWPVGTAVAFSPDGKRLAILAADGTVDLRDGTTGERIALVQGHAPGHTLRFADNDRAVVLGGGEHVFCAWEAPSGKLLTPRPGHLAPVHQVDFTADGKQLLSVSEDGVLIRWDVVTGKPVSGGGLNRTDYAEWVGPDELLEYIAPDGTRAVFGKPSSGSVRVLDMQARKEVLSASRKFDLTWMPNVTCSPCGTRMVVNPGSRYGYPKDARPNTVWDWRTAGNYSTSPSKT